MLLCYFRAKRFENARFYRIFKGFRDEARHGKAFEGLLGRYFK